MCDCLMGTELEREITMLMSQPWTMTGCWVCLTIDLLVSGIFLESRHDTSSASCPCSLEVVDQRDTEFFRNHFFLQRDSTIRPRRKSSNESRLREHRNCPRENFWKEREFKSWNPYFLTNFMNFLPAHNHVKCGLKVTQRLSREVVFNHFYSTYP